MSAVSKELVHLCRALKAPSLLASVDRLLERAVQESWGHAEFLAACLEREVSARQMHGGCQAILLPPHQVQRHVQAIEQALVIEIQEVLFEPAHHGCDRLDVRHRIVGVCDRLLELPFLTPSRHVSLRQVDGRASRGFAFEGRS